MTILSKRFFYLLLSLIFLAGNVSCTGSKEALQGKKTKPLNVLFILLDDLGLAHSTVHSEDAVAISRGFQHAEFTILPEAGKIAATASMPNLTRLADVSVRMSHAFAASPVCGPSRLAIMTARYPQRFGVYDNFDTRQPIAAEYFLSKKFQKAGYRTAIVGKWHLGRYIENFKTGRKGYGHEISLGCHPEDTPLQRGFDHYFGFNPSGTAYWNSPSLYRQEERVEVDGYLTDVFSDEAVRIVSEESESPFFLYLSYSAPHTPYDSAPEHYRSRFNTGNPQADNFYGMMAAVDDGIGRILDALKKSGQWDRTLIVFTSDNGGVSNSPLPRNGVLKGYKGMFYPGGVQVPMFIRLPGGASKTSYDYPVSLMDVLPTCLGAAGIRVPDGLDGVNLLPYVIGSDKGLPHEALFWAGPFNPQWAEGDTSYDYLRSPSFSRGPAGGGVCAWPNLMTFCEEGEIEFFDLKTRGRKVQVPTNQRRVESYQRQFKTWFEELPEPLIWSRADWMKLRH